MIYMSIAWTRKPNSRAHGNLIAEAHSLIKKKIRDGWVVVVYTFKLST